MFRPCTSNAQYCHKGTLVLFRSIRVFKDEYLLNYINVGKLGMHDEEVLIGTILCKNRQSVFFIIITILLLYARF